MSFNDYPQVDENAERSEESVNAVRNLFTHKNGFILKEEKPDYGVDFEAELIIENHGASSIKFPIQIKSTKDINAVSVDGVSLISFTFKTSRLKYLVDRLPNYGLIILYHETDQICYFDFVEEIIARLNTTPNRNGWKEQESVNILLPTDQLDKTKLKIIHQKFFDRHRNSQSLIETHGFRFNIPYLLGDNTSHDFQTEEVDFSNPETTSEFLKKHGAMLFNENEFHMVSALLERLNHSTILGSPELILMAVTTYAQLGNVIEAEYFLKKAKKISNQFSDEENGVIEFSEIRLDYLKGNIDHHSFLDRFKRLPVYEDSEENRLIREINILFFSLTTQLNNQSMWRQIKEGMDRLTAEIANATIPVDKQHLLNTYLAEAKIAFAMNKFLTDYTDFNVRESLGVKVPLWERKLNAEFAAKLQDEASKSVYEAYQFAEDNNEDLLKATAGLQIAKNFLTIQSSLLIVHQDDRLPREKTEVIQRYEKNQSLCFIANNIFLGMHLFHHAHEALTTAFEIQNLCDKLTGFIIGNTSPQKLLKIIREIEDAYDFNPFESVIDVLWNKRPEANPEETSLKGYSDERIEEIAKTILEVWKLPHERLPNLIHEMKMRRTFEEHCANPNIELLHDLSHTNSYDTYYAERPKAILRHKTLGIETKPSSDIEDLLAQFKTILQ